MKCGLSQNTMSTRYAYIDNTRYFLHRCTYLWIKEYVTVRRKPVPSRATNLLHIAFKAPRQIIMDNSPHIWFIQTHSKSHSRHYDTQLSSHETLLNTASLRRGHSGVVTFCVPFGCGFFWRLFLSFATKQQSHVRNNTHDGIDSRDYRANGEGRPCSTDSVHLYLIPPTTP